VIQQSSRYTRIPEKRKDSTFSMFIFVNSHGMSGLFSGESMCYRTRQHINLAEYYPAKKQIRQSVEADPRALT
jgi:hypothetical protein